MPCLAFLLFGLEPQLPYPETTFNPMQSTPQHMSMPSCTGQSQHVRQQDRHRCCLQPGSWWGKGSTRRRVPVVRWAQPLRRVRELRVVPEVRFPLWSSWSRRTRCGVGPAVSLWSRWAGLSSLSAWSLSPDGVLGVASLLSQRSWLAKGTVGAGSSLLSWVAGVSIPSGHSLLSLGTVVSTRAGLADGSRWSLGPGGAGVAAGVGVLCWGDVGGVLPDGAESRPGTPGCPFFPLTPFGPAGPAGHLLFSTAQLQPFGFDLSPVDSDGGTEGGAAPAGAPGALAPPGWGFSCPPS